jgi:hypothetical protein
MGYWKDKVLPTLKKTFETKNSTKKVAAAEATKTFDEAKEGYSKEFDEKKEELQPKVLEIYEASSTELKGLIKAPKSTGLKKYSTEVDKFLEELTKIEFPGSKPVHEAVTSFGPTYVRGPVTFIFEKVSTFVVVEEKKPEEAPAAAEKTTEEEASGSKDKEIVIEEEKKEEEVAAVVEPEKSEKTEPAAEPAKTEEVAPVVVEPPKP